MLSRKNEEETLHKEKDDPKSDHRRSVSENRKPQRPSTCPTKTPSNQKRSLLQTAYLTEPIAEALVQSASGVRWRLSQAAYNVADAAWFGRPNYLLKIFVPAER